MRTYAWPRVGRAGLGNALLPWARSELFAARSGASVLEPEWTSFRIGPYIRREADKRSYGKYFFSSDHVRGSAKLRVRMIARYVDEENVDMDAHRGLRPLLVQFAGLRDYFTPLLGQSTFIRERLWRMTLKGLRPGQLECSPGFIAMHVRRGDLTRQGFTPDELTEVKQYTPLSWYIGMARAVRDCPSARTLPIVVFTDGYPDEVTELTRLPGVQLRPRGSAITDLWTLSRASLLLGSGSSTFSMWSSYLGGMPTLYAPGKLSQRVLDGQNDAIELELAAGEAIPAAVSSAIDSRLSQQP